MGVSSRVLELCSSFMVYGWGHDGLLFIPFKFRGWLTNNNRLKGLSLVLTREKIVTTFSLFVVWEWGNGGLFVMSFYFQGWLWSRRLHVCIIG